MHATVFVVIAAETGVTLNVLPVAA